MNSVRLGIIGMGNMGKHHAEYVLAEKVARARLTAVASTSRASWRNIASAACGSSGRVRN
jgi:predicted dehydrogenase